MQKMDYQTRLAAETAIYRNCTDVHALPDIFHYWSDTYVRPKLKRAGFESPEELFAQELGKQCAADRDGLKRFASIGAGNCDLEVGLCRHLLAAGHDKFTIECLELNAAMLQRGRAAAAHFGVSEYLVFTEGDANHWNPSEEYDAAIANQSLHHVTELEHLFEQVRRSLKPKGAFAISDMIGRNGHQRWPEALAIVHEFWRKLPPSYRFNTRLERYEELYENFDCSVEGFEGIRSQDVLPLLLERFQFRRFVAFGNVIDPFVDRAFGFHFDAGAAWDRTFIDGVHGRDEEELRAGSIKPTHMAAVVGKGAGEQMPDGMDPRSCVRAPDATARSVPASSRGAYCWGSWPQSSQKELETACARLQETQDRLAAEQKRLQETGWRLEERTHYAAELELELARRTAWARGLEEEAARRTEWARELEREVEERTEWARSLERDGQERADRNRELERELNARAEWAWGLERELRERTEWARRLEEEARQERSRADGLEAELRGYVRRPWRFAARLGRAAWNRIRKGRR